MSSIRAIDDPFGLPRNELRYCNCIDVSACQNPDLRGTGSCARVLDFRIKKTTELIYGTGWTCEEILRGMKLLSRTGLDLS